MTELIDIFDSKMNFLGTEDREIAHQKGLWHQTFHCWIIKKIRHTPYLIFQKRDSSKKVGPNCLDITAAGHLNAGETPVKGGIREIKEELGIIVEPNNIFPLGIRTSVSEKPNNINKEFCHVYFLENNLPLKQYKFEDGEVSGLVEVKVTDGLKLFTNQIDKIECNSLLLENGEIIEKKIVIAESDFLPRGIEQRYYLKIFIMAERYFEGKIGITI